MVTFLTQSWFTDSHNIHQTMNLSLTRVKRWKGILSSHEPDRNIDLTNPPVVIMIPLFEFAIYQGRTPRCVGIDLIPGKVHTGAQYFARVKDIPRNALCPWLFVRCPVLSRQRTNNGQLTMAQRGSTQKEWSGNLKKRKSCRGAA